MYVISIEAIEAVYFLGERYLDYRIATICYPDKVYLYCLV